MDLLFYHLKLGCYVVVELKACAFKPEHMVQSHQKASFQVTTQVRIQVSTAKARRCKERKERKERNGPACFLLLCALCNLASLRWKLIEVVDLSSYVFSIY